MCINADTISQVQSRHISSYTRNRVHGCCPRLQTACTALIWTYMNTCRHSNIPLYMCHPERMNDLTSNEGSCGANVWYQSAVKGKNPFSKLRQRSAGMRGSWYSLPQWACVNPKSRDVEIESWCPATPMLTRPLEFCVCAVGPPPPWPAGGERVVF